MLKHVVNDKSGGGTDDSDEYAASSFVPWPLAITSCQGVTGLTDITAC